MRVKTRFEASDKVSGKFRKMEKNARRFGDQSSRSFKKAQKSALGFKTVLKSILAAGFIQQGFSAITQGFSEVGRQFIDFDDAITAAAVRFKDIGPDSLDFALKLDLIKQKAREAGASTIFTSAQAANALDFLARAGFTSAEAMGSLNSMINLSVATGEDFAAVADMSSDLLGAFGLNANNTAQKIKNLNRLNDVLVKTTNSANVTVENMFETMKQVGPVAAGVLGASLEEVSALTAVLGNSGIKGSDAMTALKNAYLRLAAPVGEGAKLLKALNISLDDGTGNAKKMTDLMLELRERIKGFGRVKQAKILDLIFGKRAIAGGKNILDNISNVKEFEKALLGAAGTSQRTADIMQKSLGNRLKLLGSGFVDLGFEILGGEEKFKNFVTTLTEGVNKLSNTIKRLKKEKDRPFGTSASENRRAMDALKAADKLGRGSEQGKLSALTDIFSNLVFGKDINEITSSAISRGLQAETRNLQRRETSVDDFFRTEGIVFPTQPQPDLNVDVTTNINAEGVTADTVVKAPGTSGKKAGANSF
jgi:TP901 family phage tail tape measure protein